ncbi:MAG TPA: hypothetical protein VIV11_01205 [Kofleriaceae bacterium]
MRAGSTIVVAALALSVATPAAAQFAVENVSPAFPPGPYTALTVDRNNPRRVAVGTSSGRVAWSDDAGRTAHESSALQARDYDVMSMRGTGTRFLFSSAQRTNRAIRLFNVAGAKGVQIPRWASWMALSDPITDVTAIALPSGDGRMVLASAAGVYLSDVQRTMWTRMLGGPAPMPKKHDLVGTSVAISPKDSRVVLAGTSQGLYVSRDGGFTFSPHRQLTDAIVGVIWDATRPELIVVITTEAVMQSADGGEKFQQAFANADVRDIALTDDGALVATADGLHVIEASGERKLLAGKSVVGVVPWQDGTTLVATDTALFVLGRDGGRIDLLHATEQDPFLRLVGRPPLAYALTASGVFRVGEREQRVRAQTPPRLKLSLVSLERIVMRNTIEDPEDTRMQDRWYARLLPRVIVEVRGYVDRSDRIMFDGTFPVRYRFAEATADARTERMVWAMWDLSKVVFGSGNVTNPNLLIESQLRTTRERIAKEVRTRYREAAALTNQLARPPADPLTAILWRMRLEELSAYLEALAGREVVDLGTSPLTDQGELP